MINPLAEGIRADSATAIASYELNGCEGLTDFARSRRYTLALEDGQGNRLCDAPDLPRVALLPQDAAGLSGRYVGGRFVGTLPVTSAAGKTYLLLLKIPQNHEKRGWYSDPIRLSPASGRDAVGGVTTFVLVLTLRDP